MDNVYWTEGTGTLRCKMGHPVSPSLLSRFAMGETECDKYGREVLSLLGFLFCKWREKMAYKYQGGCVIVPSEDLMADVLLKLLD